MKTWLKIIVPVGVLLMGIGGAAVINATGKSSLEPDQEASSGPLVTVRKVYPEDHRFEITSWGELMPREKTSLTAEVSGRITTLHSQFIAGGLVKQGEVLVELDDADYRTALLAAESNLARAQAEHQEQIALASVAREELRGTPNVTPLALRQPQLQSAEAAVKSAEAALQKARRDLERTRITAPYDALVKARNTGVGQVISTATVLGEIYNVEQAEIQLPIAGFDLQFLPDQVAGTQVRISTRSGARDATIVRDLGVIDAQTRMTRLVASIEDPYGIHSEKPALRFGEFVTVRIDGQEVAGIYRIPQEALVRNSIWLVDEDNNLERREVKVLRTEGRHVWIERGIQAGENLVTVPPNFPQHGMAVRSMTEDQQTAFQE